MPVVTVEEINDVLHLDLETDGNSPSTFTDSRLNEVEMALSDAEDLVREFLKIDASAWPPDDVPLRFKRAIIIAFEALFDDHKEWISGLQDTPPSGPVATILRLDRVPTIA